MKVRVESNKEITLISKKTLDPSFKGCTAVRLDDVLNFNKLNRRNSTLKMLEKPLIVSPTVIYLKKNSYLTEALNDKLNLLMSNGIIDHWIGTFLGLQYQKINGEKVGPKAMSLKSLNGVFKVSMIGWAIAFVTFLLELAIYKGNELKMSTVYLE